MSPRSCRGRSGWSQWTSGGLSCTDACWGPACTTRHLIHWSDPRLRPGMPWIWPDLRSQKEAGKKSGRTKTHNTTGQNKQKRCQMDWFFCFHCFCRILFLSTSVRVTFTLKTVSQATLVAFTFWEKCRKGRHLQNSLRDEKLCQKFEDLHHLETN